MDRDTERIERYLRSVKAPQPASDSHRQELRRRVLETAGTGARPRSVAGRALRIAAAAAILMSTGGIAGVCIGMKYHFADRGPDDARPRLGESVADANSATDVGQMARDVAEIDPSQKQNTIPLVRVIESEVNGRLDSRTFLIRYASPGWRAQSIREDDHNQVPFAVLPAATRNEVARLKQSGNVKALSAIEKTVKGRPFLFKREQYTLHDGTKVVLSVGEPNDSQKKAQRP
jgi:hypothetical protein